MAQRAAAVTEQKAISGLEQGESAATQCRSSRIKKDNSQTEALSKKVDKFCNPFSNEVANSIVNVATGRDLSKATEFYLLNAIKRGRKARTKFQEEWDHNSARFPKPMKRVVVQNFAYENVKKSQRRRC